MSIEMDNPKTPIEKIDAAANLVSQMLLANTLRDAKHFKGCHDKAAKLLYDAMRQLETGGQS
jgi:hypothetical protein